MAFVFEDLRVYQRAEACLELVYEVVAALPGAERYNLAAQLRRSALSVALNIAESTERRGADAAHFIRVALGSLVEVAACLRITHRRHYPIDPDLLRRVVADYESLYRQLHAYRRSLHPADARGSRNP